MLNKISDLFRNIKADVQEFLSSDTAKAFPQELKDANKNLVTKLKADGNEKKALQTGAQAPDFELISYNDQQVRLSELTRNGPVILTFYRGKWCPFCNIQLKHMQRTVDLFKEQGAVLVAISPQTKEMVRSQAMGATPDFELLSDPGNKVATQFGLTFHVSAELTHALGMLGVKLSEYNGEPEDKLPLSATYVIDQNNTIVYHFVDADYTQRAEPADILAVLKGLNAEKVMI